MKETKQNACIETLVGIQELKLFVTRRIFLNVMHPFLLRTHTCANAEIALIPPITASLSWSSIN